MRAQEIEDIIDGCALLDWYGNLYTVSGKKGDQIIFKSTDDSHYLKVEYEALLTGPEYHVRY